MKKILIVIVALTITFCKSPNVMKLQWQEVYNENGEYFLESNILEKETDIFLSFTFNEPVKVDYCNKQVYLHNLPGWLGYPDGWSFVIIPIQNNEICKVKVKHLNLIADLHINPVYSGTYHELILKRLNDDLSMLILSFFLLLSCIISGTLCIAGKFNKRLLNVFAILFLIFLYSLSIANSSIQIFLHFPSKMWPFLFFNSLLLLPAALSAFFRTFFTSTWAKIFLWMRNFFLLWIPIQLLIVNYLNVSFIMLFNFFHVFCIVSSLVFIIGSIQNWKRFEVIQKIPIYGNFAFLVFAIIEIIISKFTMNMSVPLLPFGGLLLFISLTIYTFKLYQLIEKRFKELQEIKSSREQRDPLSRQKRLMGINQQKIIADIENLMNNEKLFCDEDLSLNRLSDILEIRSDQLSQIINDYFHNTFTRFINGYRIEYAKELLGEGKAKIIQIAFQVGFQSKSTFNSEFKRVTKMTPKEYLQSLKIDSKED